MNFGLIPVAEASVVTLMKSINKVIINPIILFLFALALAYFLYGVAQYLLNSDSEEIKTKSKSHMLYGVIGLFIMVAVFGIMRLVLNTVGESKTAKIEIEESGDYQITNKDTNKNYTFIGDNVLDLNNYDPTGSGIFSANDLDLRSARNIDLTDVKTNRTTNFDESPFNIIYIENPLCWHEEVYATANTEYDSIKYVKNIAKEHYSSVLGEEKTPSNSGILTSYDAENAVYHSWMDARGPKKGGTDEDCVLKVDIEKTKKIYDELPIDSYVNDEIFTKPRDMSLNPPPEDWTGNFSSDPLFHRVMASGSNPLLVIARNLAIKNAFALLGIEIQEINAMTIVYPTASILEESYTIDPKTGNYEYWVAIESKKTTTESNITLDQYAEKVKPFTKTYESDDLFLRIVDYGTSTELATAREIALSNALMQISFAVCGDGKDNDGDGSTDKNDAMCHLDGDATNDDSYLPTYYSENIVPPIDFSGGEISLSSGICNDGIDNDGDEKTDIEDPQCHTDGNAGNSASYVPSYESESIIPPVDLAAEIDWIIVLEEKQIFNEETGEYEYWVAIESPHTMVDGASPVSQSFKAIPFTKIYKTDGTYYRVIDSGVDISLGKAREIAINNAFIKLEEEVEGELVGVQYVTILEEKHIFDSKTGLYEYWVVLQATKKK